MKKCLIFLLLLIFSSICFADQAPGAASLLTKKLINTEKIKPNPYHVVIQSEPSQEYLDRQTRLQQQMLQKEIQRWMYTSVKNVDYFFPIIIPPIWVPNGI